MARELPAVAGLRTPYEAHVNLAFAGAANSSHAQVDTSARGNHIYPARGQAMNEENQAKTLGQELKRRREARGIELQEIANATRVAVRFLRAIEEDDFSALPGGLFTRSFIRTYARHVGMDEEQAVSRYYEQIGQPRDEPTRLTLASEGARRARISFLTATMVTVAIVGVLGLGGWAGWNYWQRKHRSPLPAPSSGGALPTTPSVEQPPPTIVVNAEPQMTNPPEKKQPPAEGPLEIRLEAHDECWISYLTDEETKPIQLILKPHEVRTLSAHKSVRLSVGKVTAVKLTINGQPAELPAMGLVARDVLITRDNVSRFIRR